MIGHGEKLTRKQEVAIAALLASSTIVEAARSCGLGEATLFRWMQIPAFMERYDRARRAVLHGAICELQTVSREAADTLRRLLTCGASAVECRAALAMLDVGMRECELQDLSDRVSDLEQASRTTSRGRT